MVVLVAGERQAEALDRIGEEADRPVVLPRLLEGIEQARQVVAAEIGHELRQLLVRALLDEPRHRPLVAEVVEETLAPSGAALIGQGGIELVRAGIDPVAQALAAGLLEGLLHQHAVLEDHHVPAEIAEQRLEALPQALADHRVEALAVVVDDPPRVADAVLPALEQRLEDVALVHLRIADERDHAAFRPVLGPAMGLHVILHQAGKQRLCDAEAHRPGGEIDVVDVLGAGGIGLRALVAAEILQLLPGLAPEQILDRVVDRAGMGLHRHPVLRPQSRKIQRGQDRGEGSGRRLVPADLQAVLAGAQVIGVVDRPGGEPEHLTLEFLQDAQVPRVRHKVLPVLPRYTPGTVERRGPSPQHRIGFWEGQKTKSPPSGGPS